MVKDGLVEHCCQCPERSISLQILQKHAIILTRNCILKARQNKHLLKYTSNIYMEGNTCSLNHSDKILQPSKHMAQSGYWRSTWTTIALYWTLIKFSRKQPSMPNLTNNTEDTENYLPVTDSKGFSSDFRPHFYPHIQMYLIRQQHQLS